MRKALSILLAFALTPAVVVMWAATAAGASTGPTTVSFAIPATGSLSITTPDSVSLGTATAGASSIAGALGAVTVTDTRNTLLRGWTATVSSTDFLTGTGTGTQDISSANVSYSPGAATSTTGVGSFSAGSSGALSSSRTAFSASAQIGSTTASWNPTITITLPSSAPAGTYTGTITHSVA